MNKATFRKVKETQSKFYALTVGELRVAIARLPSGWSVITGTENDIVCFEPDSDTKSEDFEFESISTREAM